MGNPQNNNQIPAPEENIPITPLPPIMEEPENNIQNFHSSQNNTAGFSTVRFHRKII